MKTIVCYGDSNTWGARPDGQGRFDLDTRWTGILAKELGQDYRVCEEGLNGRTTNLEDIIERDRNGYTYLKPCLESHAPIDLITLMLGTNDLKDRFHRCAGDIAMSAAFLCDYARNLPVGLNGGHPIVLLMAPPVVVEMGDLASIFEGAIEKSKRFSVEYATWANRLNLPFLDTTTVIVSSPVDGIHIDAPEHSKLGKAVAAKVRELIP
jgi:lysophospholipase L1-like esterase